MDSVLVVDDHSDARAALRAFLTKEPYDINEAADAEEALHVLSASPVAVVVCDKFMPGKDGLWLILQIRKLRPDVAIVIASADDSILPVFTLQAGIIAYFVKPLDFDKVRDAIREGIAWHHAAKTAALTTQLSQNR
jgi:DNA-binding NtrC family response regulator